MQLFRIDGTGDVKVGLTLFKIENRYWASSQNFAGRGQSFCGDKRELIVLNPQWLTLCHTLSMPDVITEAYLEQNQGFIRLSPHDEDNEQSHRLALIWLPGQIDGQTLEYTIPEGRTIKRFNPGSVLAYLEPGETIPALRLRSASADLGGFADDQKLVISWDGANLAIVNADVYEPNWSVGTTVM